MKSNIEAISDLLSEQIGCTQKERMEQYSKWNVYWNHIAKHQNINESNDITQKIISMLNAQEENSKERQVLEIGCGTGEYTLNLAANYQHVTAVDMSEQMLCVLKQRAEKEKITNIYATIYCEKASHKGIIIGKHGEMLKKIGTMARGDIEKMLDKKVYLELWVKVKSDWRNSDFLIKNFGFTNE